MAATPAPAATQAVASFAPTPAPSGWVDFQGLLGNFSADLGIFEPAPFSYRTSMRRTLRLQNPRDDAAALVHVQYQLVDKVHNTSHEIATVGSTFGFLVPPGEREADWAVVDPKQFDHRRDVELRIEKFTVDWIPFPGLGIKPLDLATATADGSCTFEKDDSARTCRWANHTERDLRVRIGVILAFIKGDRYWPVDVRWVDEAVDIPAKQEVDIPLPDTSFFMDVTPPDGYDVYEDLGWYWLDATQPAA